jgi:hypothetical protein
MDTMMPETFDPSYSQRKRTCEKTSGPRKKAKAHRKPLQTSLKTNDVELITTTIEDQLSKVWDNVEKCNASIMEQVQEVKTTL